jgi:hypothetical protein
MRAFEIEEMNWLTENLFFADDDPAFKGVGRDRTLLPPTLRDPSLILDEVD